ncbi:M24 family metallopeptidase [Rhabdothermincola sp.]|uniref:M24 family metallopeptidase n=1 Tax=Rhabdothermincola sp. TaxID=2820405 RepID=UPI002FE1F3DB
MSSPSPHAARVARVRRAMEEAGVDVLLLSVGADLPWLIGYEAMPLERLTMLVVPRDAQPTLVVPALEAPRVREEPEVFGMRTWDETDDPVELVAGLAGSASVAAIGNRTWAQFLIELQQRMPGTTFRNASDITGPLRAVKEPGEIAALRRAAAAVDRVAGQLQQGEIPLVGRTEAEVAAELGRRILAEGHQRVNFAIVASGENAASPHHEPGNRVIQPNEIVLCDFGGTMAAADGAGYCSDITRCVYTGEPPPEVRDLYRVLRDAQEAAVAGAKAGVTGEEVDAIARGRITEAGFGECFIHRTGHGIGVEEHEDPYIVAGNHTPLVAGNAFSIEPGIYLAGRFGARLEDIVVVGEGGPEPLNAADHDLVPVDA